MATARKDFDPPASTPGADLLDADGRAHAAGAGRDRRPAAPGGEGGDRHRARRRDPGPHDHRRPRDHRRRRSRGELGIEGRAITGAQFAELSDEQADAEIDEIGVIARVTPGAEGPPRRHPQAQGPRRRR